MDRIHDEAEAQETRQELGDQSAAGWASGMSAPNIPLGPRRTSARCRAGNSQAQSEDTGSTQGSTFVEDDATVSSLGNPEGTYDLGAQQTKVKQCDRPIKMELCPQMNPGTTHCNKISPLATQ